MPALRTLDEAEMVRVEGGSTATSPFLASFAESLLVSLIVAVIQVLFFGNTSTTA
jgi:hypothetical protein